MKKMADFKQWQEVGKPGFVFFDTGIKEWSYCRGLTGKALNCIVSDNSNFVSLNEWESTLIKYKEKSGYTWSKLQEDYT